MTAGLINFIGAHGHMVEQGLEELLPVSTSPGTDRLNAALRYSVFPPGKRLRPMLTLVGTKLVQGDAASALPAACAIEFLHTSSLIFDDLPLMDDADLRRGRPSTHLVFGEGIALLAALALFNQAYALLAQTASRSGAQGLAGALVAEATRCIGSNGMIGGQAVDLELRSLTVRSDASASRNLKTTALMRLTMTAGAIGCGAAAADVEALGRFGECLGLAYQVCDDLLDELGQSELIGKPARQDERHLRPTFVAELGIEGAYNLAMRVAEEGKSVISERFVGLPQANLLSDAVDLVIGDVLKLGLVGQFAV